MTENNENNKKSVIISGASRGIGRATAVRFAKEGFTVGIGCRNLNAGFETAKTVEYVGGRAVILQGDLRDGRDVGEMYEKFKAEVGVPDALVNCAGIAYQELFQYTAEGEYDRIMDSNLRSAYLLTKEVLPDMIARKSGSVIFISSMWGQVGGACEVVYSASKAALIGMTKALAKEVGPSGVRVNCVSPGVIVTDMTTPLGSETLAALADETPLCRNGQPIDVANAIYLLCSNETSFITGQVLGVNGGYVV